MPKVAQLTIATADITANYALNVLKYLVEFDGSKTDLANLLSFIDAWRADVEAPFLATMAIGSAIENYSAKVINGDGSVTQMLAVHETGTAETSGMFAGVCMDIAINTNDINNRWGHIYLPACPEGFVDLGQWQAAAFSAAGDLITALKPQLTWTGGGSAQFGTYHKKTDTFSPMIDGTLRPKPTLMNKRLKPIV